MFSPNQSGQGGRKYAHCRDRADRIGSQVKPGFDKAGKSQRRHGGQHVAAAGEAVKRADAKRCMSVGMSSSPVCVRFFGVQMRMTVLNGLVIVIV